MRCGVKCRSAEPGPVYPQLTLWLAGSRLCAAAQALQRVRGTRVEPAISLQLSSLRGAKRRSNDGEGAYTAFTRTRNPSRGFGIGHICQSGL
ncbi:hypothetical protein ABID62_004551 [Bradyrhizobium sp. S3.9.1]